MDGTIYLIHLDAPLGDPERPHMSASHYLGFTPGDVDERLALHAKGQGSALLTEARRRGITWRLVWTRPGDRTLQRKLKNTGHFGDRLCGCKPASPRRSA